MDISPIILGLIFFAVLCFMAAIKSFFQEFFGQNSPKHEEKYIVENRHDEKYNSKNDLSTIIVTIAAICTIIVTIKSCSNN